MAVASLLGSLLLVAGAPGPLALAETEKEAREAAAPRDDGRTYQRDSVEGFGGRALRAATWVKERLSGFHVTPARLLAGLGLLGVLVTWNKNKRKQGWAVLAGISWLLLLGGAAAILTGWSVLA
jgi:hypothetical protein